MTTIQEVYTALADGPLSDVGLRAFDHVPGDAEWPAAYVHPPTLEFEGLNPSVVEAKFEIVVLVSAALDKKQKDLLPFQDLSGPKSIVSAVLADPSLGLTGVSVTVTRTRPMRLVEQADYRAFGAVVECKALIG